MNAADRQRISDAVAAHPFPASEQGDNAPAEPRYRAVAIVTPAGNGYRLPTLEEALAVMWAAQEEYSIALELAYAAHVLWSDLDNQSSRERYAATLRLMEAMKISSTAADKIATQDAEYAMVRDDLASRLNAKLDAEADRDDALSRLISARVTVQALIARDGARAPASAKPESLLDRQRTIAFMTPEDRDELRAILDGHAEDDAIATGQAEPERPSRGDVPQFDTLDEKRGRN